MKKILFPLVAISMLSIACKKDNQNDEAKLPSKIMSHLERGDETITSTMTFEYDGQNRLTKVVSDDKTELYEYNADHSLAKRINVYERRNDTTLYSYSGNTVLVKHYLDNTDTLTIVDGLLIRKATGFEQITYTYNSSNNVERKESILNKETNYINIYTYSNVKAIFRHSNTPDWVFVLYHTDFSKNGYMPKTNTYKYSEQEDGTTTPYEYVVSNGYPTKMTSTSIHGEEEYSMSATIEYIDAK